ncbi:MAG: SGNH/GDSL hydrolase family protein [Alphaproteobacteria bacterium]|nr:SGNH/GDSL hydrolase family protein [Alphaproteobacteria bacterium]
MAFYAPDATGTLPPDPGAWSLHHRQGLQADAAAARLILEVEASEGGELMVSPAGAEGPTLRLLRLEGRRPEVDGARCEGALAAWTGARYRLEIERTSEGFAAGDLRCAAALPQAGPALVAGVRRVNVHTLATEAGAAPSPLPPPVRLGAGLVGALAVLTLAGVERWTGRRNSVILLTWTPALLGVALRRADPAMVAEALRMPALDTPWLAVAAAVGPAVGLKLLVEAGMRMRATPVRAVAALAGGAALLSAALGATKPLALAGFGLSGAALGVVLWANVNAARLRRFNLISLAAFAVGVAGLELGARHTLTGVGWSVAYGWSWVDEAADRDRSSSSPVHDFLGLARGKHTAYPSAGYPVAFGPRQAPVRLVAFGGSSTGGASHNSSLDEFYPARMDELLGPGVEVVNQGVGGWTTFHIREYARARLAELAPDLVTLYVSCNDSGDGPPDTYERLYQSWRARSRGEAVAGPLRRMVLYQGLVSVLTPARARSDVPAVTTAEMDHNLRTLAALAQDLGARVLLMSEGAVRPRAPALEAHYAVMRAVAEDTEGVAFLDTARALDEGGPGLFVDRVHLSDAGHRLVARLAVDELRALGWVSAPGEGGDEIRSP